MLFPSHPIPSLRAASGISLDVAGLDFGKSSGSPATPAAHLRLSGTPLPLSAASTHRKAWKVRQVVHSWVHRKLGVRIKFNMYSFPVGYKSIIRTGKCSLSTYRWMKISFILGCPGPVSSCTTNANYWLNSPHGVPWSLKCRTGLF